jgi:erythromycin esterase
MPSDDAVCAWLRENARPIDLDSSTDDLQWLRQTLGPARVVGFAESTHGTKEFFELRHRLLRLLVEKMEFNALAIEASYSAAQAVNDYVVEGIGDRAAVLTGLGFVMWDVEEFAAVLDWLRDYNRSVSEPRKVRFYGLDIWNTRPGREAVLAFLRKVAPHYASSLAPLFERIAAGEAAGMMRAHEQVDVEMFRTLEALVAFLADNHESFVRQTSAGELEQVMRHAAVILQWASVSLTDQLPGLLPQLPRMSTLNNYARSRYMAENLIAAMERDHRPAKIIVWAHVFHLGLGFEDSVHGRVATLGQHLKQTFGQDYYVFGMELNEGAYLARAWLPDDTLGDLKLGNIPPAPQDSLSAYLSRAGAPVLMLDLRHRARVPDVERWLSAPRPLHAVSWAHRESSILTVRRLITEAYDGILFIARTHATTPTPNAVSSVAQRAGY